MKLVQRHWLKSTWEIEIVDDLLHVRIKSLFKEEKLTLVLSMINPEPVANGRWLEFYSRVKSDPLLSLYLDKPDSETFDRFVNALKRRAREEYAAFAGLRSSSRPEGLAANSYDEPPEFGAPAKPRLDESRKPVSVASIDSSIRMLQQHLNIDEIKPLLAALEALKSNPQNESGFVQLVNAFDDLGSRQGAVLTYAPYVRILLSADPFGY